MAPNLTAIIFWLKNRWPEVWRDVQEHLHDGKIEGGNTVITQIFQRAIEDQTDGARMKMLENLNTLWGRNGRNGRNARKGSELARVLNAPEQKN
jgi:hypothetical protein